jgi:hypothetical protein
MMDRLSFFPLNPVVQDPATPPTQAFIYLTHAASYCTLHFAFPDVAE